MSRPDIFSPGDVEQWKSYYDLHGYCILRNIFPTDTLSNAKAACNGLVDELAQRLVENNIVSNTYPEAPFEERLALVCQNCPTELPNLFRSELHSSPAFYNLLCHEQLINAVRELMLPEVDGLRIFPNYSCRPKTSSPLHSVTWHQDSGLRADGGPSTASVEERTDAFGLGRVVNCWAPLVEATAENGAMKFIRGSQNRGILEHVFLGSYNGSTASGERLPDSVDGSQVSKGAQHVPAGTYMTGVRQDLIEEDIKSDNCIDVECSPGDVVLFSNILVHRGGVNTTDKIRWSFDWRFQDSSKSTFRAENGHIISSLTGKTDDMCNSGEEWVKRSLM